MITLPTIQQLKTTIQADLESSYGSNIPSFGKNFLRTIAGVLAGILWLQYKYIGFVQKNVFPDTSDSEAVGGTLERSGRIKLGRNPFPARAGQYIVNVVGTIGAVVNAKTVFVSAEDSASPGKLFVLDAKFTLESEQDQMILRALEAGLDSQLDVYDQLTSTIPIANVEKTVTVAAESIAPLAAETLEEYRAKVLAAYRTEPQGGAATDYRLWASDAAGVRQVYPYAKTNAPCEINLYIEATQENSTDGKGTPSATIIDEVEQVVNFDPDTTKPINDRGRRPLQVIVNYEPVTIRSITIIVFSYTGITAAIQAENLTEISSMIEDIRPFVAGADIASDRNDILNVNKIIGKLLEVNPGAIFGNVTLKVDGIETSSQTFINGDIPYLESISYS